MSSLKPKFLYNLTVSLLYSIAPILVFPYISRVLGPEYIGKIAFVEYIAQLFILFASFGIPLYGTREIAKARSHPLKLKNLVSELVSIHFILSFLSALAFVGFIIIRPGAFNEKGLFILAVINVMINSFTLDWFVVGAEDFKFYSIRSYVIKLASIAAVFLLIRKSADYQTYYLILVIANLAIILIDIIYVYRKGIRFVISGRLKQHLRPLFVFFLTTAAISIYNYFDTIILGFISGAVAVGFYTTALKIVRLSQNFVNDAGGVLLPRVSYLVNTNEKKEVRRIIQKALNYVLTVSIPLSFLFLLSAPEIIQLIAGKKFLSSIPVLTLLAVLPLVLGLSNVYGIQILLPHGKEKYVLIAVVSGCVTSIVLNIILCPIYGEKGAALACLGAELCVTLIMGFAASKVVQLTYSLKLLMGVLLSCLLFIPLIWASRVITDVIWLKLIIFFLGCSISFVAVQIFIFKNVMVKEMVSFLLKKISLEK